MKEIRLPIYDIEKHKSPIFTAASKGLPVKGVLNPRPGMEKIKRMFVEEDYKTNELVITWEEV